MLGSWGKLLGVGQQSVGLRIQIVLGPSGGNNLGTEVLIVGQAAHGRRVKAQSRCAAYETVDRRREHLSLQATQRGGLAHVQISMCKSYSCPLLRSWRHRW
jgi:hypothetical protein